MTMLRALPGLLLAVVLTVVMHAAGAQEFVPVPPLKARVTDMAGMLDANQRATLENVLQDYEQRTGSQIAILLIKSTAPEAIEQYSIRVYDEWKLGRKGIDDGVLLLVAKDNPPVLRRLRIEAGRGVQGTLTDAQSKRILQDVIAPHFRQNDFYGGLAAGVSAIGSLLDKENMPAPDKQKTAQNEGGIDFPLLLFFIFMIIFIAISRARSRFGHRRDGWGRSSGIILGGGLGSGGFGDFGGGDFGGGGFGGGGGGFGGGGFSGGGGSADGGGASGNW